MNSMELLGDEVGPPDVRAYWFLDTPSRPVLYHAIRHRPATAGAARERFRA